MFYKYHSGNGENWRGKPTYMIVYCPWVNLHLLKANPGKCFQMVRYYLLINIPQNSLDLSHWLVWLMNAGKGSRFLLLFLLIYEVSVDNGEVKVSKKKNSLEIRDNQFFILMLMFTSHAPYIWQKMNNRWKVPCDWKKLRYLPGYCTILLHCDHGANKKQTSFTSLFWMLESEKWPFWQTETYRCCPLWERHPGCICAKSIREGLIYPYWAPQEPFNMTQNCWRGKWSLSPT